MNETKKSLLHEQAIIIELLSYSFLCSLGPVRRHVHACFSGSSPAMACVAHCSLVWSYLLPRFLSLVPGGGTVSLFYHPHVSTPSRVLRAF